MKFFEAVKATTTTRLYSLVKPDEERLKSQSSYIMIGQVLRVKDRNIWIKIWLRRNIELFQKITELTVKKISTPRY
ncbi:hypothetical protein A8L34_16345 [Bacillus sp. FJAT-27264]|nr:hypothetical protein A8L34_16345 [Bacillus sp. FJAT-27264]